MGDKPKVAIIGADGQLGSDLVRAFHPDFEVIKFVRGDFDVIDSQAVEKAILGVRPTFIVNTAAFHNTEDCERNPEKSFLVNAMGAWNVARVAQAVGAGVIYISTD